MLPHPLCPRVRPFLPFLALALLPLARPAHAEPVTLGNITLDSHQTYYDGSNGSLATEIPLPAGATQLIFDFRGGVITDGSNRLASPDGLYDNSQTPYNFSNTRFAGTYLGVPIGATTGIDPAIFGVFFDPNFSGTPENSLSYRSDSGISPDPRTLLSYSPSLNQPFWIGDGFSENTPYSDTQFDPSYVPPGTQQIFNIPSGATFLLLGIGADINLADNQNSANQDTQFSNIPEPATLSLLALATLPILLRRRT